MKKEGVQTRKRKPRNVDGAPRRRGGHANQHTRAAAAAAVAAAAAAAAAAATNAEPLHIAAGTSHDPIHHAQHLAELAAVVHAPPPPSQSMAQQAPPPSHSQFVHIETSAGGKCCQMVDKYMSILADVGASYAQMYALSHEPAAFSSLGADVDEFMTPLVSMPQPLRAPTAHPTLIQSQPIALPSSVVSSSPSHHEAAATSMLVDDAASIAAIHQQPLHHYDSDNQGLDLVPATSAMLVNYGKTACILKWLRVSTSDGIKLENTDHEMEARNYNESPLVSIHQPHSAQNAAHPIQDDEHGGHRSV